MKDFCIEFGRSQKAEEVAQNTYRFYFNKRTGNHHLVDLFSENSPPSTRLKLCDFSDKGHEWFISFAEAWLKREGHLGAGFYGKTPWIGFTPRVEFRRGRWCWKNKYHT